MNTTAGNHAPLITPVPNRLRGKVAFVTGAARGIGRAIAVRFAQEGADIAIADICAGGAAETQEEIRALGRDAIVQIMDVTDRASVKAAVDDTIDHFSGIDILVNNAGIIVFGSIMECTPADWTRMLDVDLTGALHCTQLVGAHMRTRNRPARMIHIGSTASLLPTIEQGPYCVAKAGLRMLSMMAALELGPYGITSNLLCPEVAVTDMNRELLSDPEVLHKLEGKIPLGRVPTTEEIAASAAFLASDEAAYITGSDLLHDGGMTISPLWWR